MVSGECAVIIAALIVTLPNEYPLPHFHDFSIALYVKTFFSTLDLIRAYNQILVAPEDVPKTAVKTPIGFFEYLRMPFGLRNASQSFQGYRSHTLFDLDFEYTYIDEIIVFLTTQVNTPCNSKTKSGNLLVFTLKNFLPLKQDTVRATAIKETIRYFSHFLDGKDFTIR